MFLKKMPENNYLTQSKKERGVNPSTFYQQRTEEINQKLQEQLRKDNSKDDLEIEWLEETLKNTAWI